MPKTSDRRPESRGLKNRAPESLAVIQDFLNTSKTPRRAETLDSPAALAGWLVDRRLLPPGSELTEEDLAFALETREGFRALLRAGPRRRVAESVLAGMNGAMERAAAPLRFTSDGGLCLAPVAGGFDDVLGHLFGLVLMAIYNDEWTRLATCANDECRTVFWDESRRRSRRWCQKRCGDLVRARTRRSSPKYREQQRQLRKRRNEHRPDYSALGDITGLSQAELLERLRRLRQAR